MKTTTKRIFLFGLILSSLTFHAKAQVQYNGCSVTGTYASAIGKGNNASGNNSFAGGYGSQSSGSNSFAFGYNSKATQSTTTAIGNTAIASGSGSVAIGNYVKATAQNSFVFGSGATASYPLTNSTSNSIAFGTNSNKPTMLITKSLNNNYTGKVAIGQVTNPQAKLHVKSDNNEDAGVFIEPTNTNSYKAFIKLFDSNHSITVDKSAAMVLNSGDGNLYFRGGSYCFGTPSERRLHVYTQETPTLYVNATRVGNTETRDSEGTSFAIDFDNNGLCFRSAVHQSPRGSAITNWKNTLFLCNDGKIGIGSTNTYLENTTGHSLRISAPNTLDLQSDNITLTGNATFSGNTTLTGKIGINTVNNANGYALAVNGGIISTKVFIKEVQLWPDYVFADDYALMGLDELKTFIKEKRHLPGLPTEAEVISSGYDLNEMQTLMLEKIEEMARYILILRDEIEELKSNPTSVSDSIVFFYDGNGNRIARNLVFQRIYSPDPTNQDSQAIAYYLYPNPTPGRFSVILNEQDKKVQMHAVLLTANGVIISERDIENGQASFDLSGNADGIYLLEIESPEGHQTWKVIKR